MRLHKLSGFFVNRCKVNSLIPGSEDTSAVVLSVQLKFIRKFCGSKIAIVLLKITGQVGNPGFLFYVHPYSIDDLRILI